MNNNASIDALEQGGPLSVAVTAQRLAVQDGWISVKDALPEIDNSGHIQNTRVTVLAVRDYEGPVSQMSYVVIRGSQSYWTYADGRSSRFGPTHWMYMPIFPAAPAAQGDAKDTCAEMRALCSACGGTGDVHSIDGEWRGQCTCVHAWQWRAEKAEAELKQVNEWRAAALAENMQLGERWAKRIAELEVQLGRRGALLSPETQQAIAAARAAGQTIAATPGGLVFINDGVEPDYSKLDCPACGGSGHAGDVAAGSAP